MSSDFNPVSPEDRIRVQRIRQSIDELAELTLGSCRADLNSDLRTRKAVLHSLIEIGEGASRLSNEFRVLLPDVPWPQIVQMRNVLVHVYWGINLDRVWDAATVHAPALGVRLRSLVTPIE